MNLDNLKKRDDIMSDYLNDVLVRMAYHSTTIEGNTLTFPETVSILIDNQIANQKTNIREFFEIENHRQAFNYLLEERDKGTSLDMYIVKNFHYLLMDRLQHDCGEFKSQDNAILKANFQTTPYQQVPMLMQQHIDNLNYQLANLNNLKDFCDVMATQHIEFERIHPFSDGNGRTGRFILMYESFLHNDVPIVISSDKRNEYLSLLAEQDTAGLSNLFKESISFEKERFHLFENTAQLSNQEIITSYLKDEFNIDTQITQSYIDNGAQDLIESSITGEHNTQNYSVSFDKDIQSIEVFDDFISMIKKIDSDINNNQNANKQYFYSSDKQERLNYLSNSSVDYQLYTSDELPKNQKKTPHAWAYIFNLNTDCEKQV